jgi:hypothetical protein
MPGTRDASKYRERAEKWREEAEALRLARNGTRAWCSPRGTRTSPRLSRKRTLVALAREAIDARDVAPKHIQPGLKIPPPSPVSRLLTVRASTPNLKRCRSRFLPRPYHPDHVVDHLREMLAA